MNGSTKPNVILRSPVPGDWGWILSKHEEVFDQEFHWDVFKLSSNVSTTLGTFIPKTLLPGHGAWIAEVNGIRVGSVLLDKENDSTSRIRLLIVAPEARGHGVGRKLVEKCMEFSKISGYSKLMLFTTSAQTDGLRLYQKLGFRVTNRSRTDIFGPELGTIYMEIDL